VSFADPTEAVPPQVWSAFEVDPAEASSLWPLAPVFRVTWRGRAAVLKRTQHPAQRARELQRWLRALELGGVPCPFALVEPVESGDDTWVLYPYASGEPYRDLPGALRAAGRLLSDVHRVAQGAEHELARFRWIDETNAASRAEDRESFEALAARVGLEDRAVERWNALIDAYYGDVTTALKRAELPVCNTTFDFKANNLLFSEGRLRLLDVDRAARVPRVLDLALAVLLFRNEHPHVSPALFTPAEWAAFANGYLEQGALTPDERRLFPKALHYMLIDEGLWLLLNDDWTSPRQRCFLESLLETDLAAYQP
jgi:spectinomycin phosphotransferase